MAWKAKSFSSSLVYIHKMLSGLRKVTKLNSIMDSKFNLETVVSFRLPLVRVAKSFVDRITLTLKMLLKIQRTVGNQLDMSTEQLFLL
jgi:hypothetical protein